jgi:hypothetical protein
MIANISPANSCCEHTLNSLRYADRVKELKEGGGGSSLKGGQVSNDEKKIKELGLARDSKNVTKIKLDQNTLMPKNVNSIP